MARPDFSHYLAHFTTSRPSYSSDQAENPTNAFNKMTALERLISILSSQKIVTSKIRWAGRNAVCFTECPWSSLIPHAENYSPYAVGFSKPRIFAAGGSPAFYIRADHWEKQEWDESIKAFVTPFWPSYRPERLKTDDFLHGSTIDYSHEREWRVPHDFTFKLEQVEFVIVERIKDIFAIPSEIVDGIGVQKFLPMETYLKIEELWPVHQL